MAILAKFVVIHGTFIDGKEKTGYGGVLELTAEQKAHLDPDGNKLVTPEVFEAMQKKAAAQAVIEKPEAAPAPVAPKPTPKKEGGK